MSYTLKIRGELRPVNPPHALVACALVVRDDGHPYGPPDTPGDTSSPSSIPPGEAHARRIAGEAERWLAFATERTRMTPATLTSKALSAACFSAAKRASSLSVPTKLSGVRAHQRTLWALVRDRVPTWTPLELDVTEEAINVRFCGEVVGRLQPKHRGWVKPLVPFGARLYLAGITGSERSGYTLGVNVVVGHVGEALDRLLDALGQAGFGEAKSGRTGGGTGGDDAGGDGAKGDGAGCTSVDGIRAGGTRGDGSHPRTSYSGGDGAAGGPRLAVPAAGADPDADDPDGDASDVVLYREIDGTARCSVRHAVRHSPSGIEWGYHGSGPADLARSVLLAFTDEATAERRYQAFKADVVAVVPSAGGVIRAADVRAWLASRGTEQDADDR